MDRFMGRCNRSLSECVGILYGFEHWGVIRRRCWQTRPIVEADYVTGVTNSELGPERMCILCRLLRPQLLHWRSNLVLSFRRSIGNPRIIYGVSRCLFFEGRILMGGSTTQSGSLLYIKCRNQRKWRLLSFSLDGEALVQFQW